MKGVRFAEVPVVSTPFNERKESNAFMSTPGMLGAQTPNQISPDENLDWKNLAGRTPHNKKLDAAKNMDLLHKQLFGGDITPSAPAQKNKWSLEVTSTPLEKSTNVRVISPDPCDDSAESPAPLTPYKAELLFGSSDTPESVHTSKIQFAPQNDHSPLPEPVASEKVGFILPVKDESERKNFPKQVQSTPFAVRPVFNIVAEDSVDGNEDEVTTPNVSVQQADKSSVYTPVMSSAPASAVMSPIPLHNSFVVSPTNSSQNSSQCVKSLFESPVSRSIPPPSVETAPTSEVKEMNSLPEPQATPAQFVQILKQDSPLAPAVSNFVYEQPSTHNSPVKADISQSSSLSAATPATATFRDLASPLLLHRAGGVAKGRGPSSTAASFAATVAYITAPPAAAPFVGGHEVVTIKHRIIPTEASEPIGQPVVAYPTSPAVRKVNPELQPKKADFACSPITVPVESQAVNMCNVSIQTSLVLDTFQNLSPKASGKDSSSMVHSPIASNSAPVSHYSPMFTSYYAAHPDSDSEAEELENLENALDDCALMDLIGGSNSAGIPMLHSSPLSSKPSAGLNSSLNNVSMRSTGSVGAARRVTIKEQQFQKSKADESDDDCLPVLLGNSFPTSVTAAAAPAAPSALKVTAPTPAVVPIVNRPPLHFDTQLFLREQQAESHKASVVKSHSFHHERSVSFVSDLDMDVTDAAVKLHDDSELHYSDNEEQEVDEGVEGLQYLMRSRNAVVSAASAGVNLADYSTAETTMTLDQAVNDSFSSTEGAAAGQPRLAIQSMKRDKSAVPDMKEIILQCDAGAFTTTVLHFSNKQSRPLILRPQTIQIRYEPGASSSVSDHQSLNYFKVSPSELNILPGEDNQLYITFTPPRGASGNFSGVVKIKSNKKSFTMLLRGEASTPAGAANKLNAPMVTQPTSVHNVLKPEPFEVVSAPTPMVVERPFRSSAVEEIYRRNISEAAAKPAYFAMQTETLLQQRQRTLQQRIQDLKKKQESPKNTQSFVASRSFVSSAVSTVQSPANASVASSVSVEGLSIAEECVKIRQVASSNQFEGSLTVRNDSNKVSQVTISTSASCLKCFKSSYKIAARSSVNVRIMLDSSNGELQQMCRRVSSSMASGGSNRLGFVSVRMDNQEFNLEVTLPLSLCQVISQQYSTAVTSVPTPTATVYAVNAVRHETPSMDTTKVDIHSDGKKIVVNKDLSQLYQRGSQRSEEVDESNTTTSRYNQLQQQSHKGKYTVAYEQTSSTFSGKEGTYAVPNKTSATVCSGSKKDKQRVSSNGGHGVYFRMGEARFGAVTIGSLTRTRIDLCNGTDEEVTVYLSDPSLPFVLLPVHSEIHLRPRSYVRVPLRFIPVAAGEFNEQLVAQTSDGSYQAVISLSGFASERK